MSDSPDHDPQVIKDAPGGLKSKVVAARENASLLLERAPAALRRPRQLAYIGGEGDQNLGDEVMYDAIADLLGARLLSVRYPAQERRWSWTTLSGPRFFAGAVLGGGTLINPHWYEKVKTALDQGLPMWALGTGVGSAGFGMPERLELQPWRELLEQFEGVGVRGPRSVAALRDIGVDHAEEIGDVALLYARPPISPRKDAPTFVLNVTRPDRPARDDTDYDALIDIVTASAGYLLKEGWLPIPIAMHRTDVDPTMEVLRRLGCDAEVHSPQDAEEFFHLAEAATLTIAVRLHAAVLATCVGVPPLLIAYRSKCLDFMESVGLGRWCVPASELDAIESGVRQLASEASALRGDISTTVGDRARVIREFVRRSGLAAVGKGGG